MVKLVYITSSMFSYTKIWFLYSRCLNGFFAIYEVLHIKDVVDFSIIANLLMFVAPQITFIMFSFFYAPIVELFTTYYISINMYFDALPSHGVRPS